LVVANFTPTTHFAYPVGVPRGGFWKELLNSDAVDYGGSGQGNLGGVSSSTAPAQGYHQSITIAVPPLSVVFFKNENPRPIF
jgi:1,4-alpha-glucan branching enzyme